MKALKAKLQHFGAVTALVQAAKEHRVRSVVVAGLYSDANSLAKRIAVDLNGGFGISSTLFHFEPGRHRWQQFRTPGIEVYEEAPTSVRAASSRKHLLTALALQPQHTPTPESEVELVPDISFSALRATIDELQEQTSMLIMSAPPLLTDPEAMVALSLIPRVILTVPSPADRNDLISVSKALQAANVELLGAVLTNYRNPLPRWLDLLLGYR